MRKILGRFLILFGVFMIGLITCTFFQNTVTTDNRTDMNDATLPELMVDMDGVLANRMYGYVQKMQVDFTRDSLTPLDTTKSMVLVVNPYQSTVRSLSYEIRTCDGSRVIENHKVKNFDSCSFSENYLAAKVAVDSDLLMNQEYSMQITLETESRPVYYYTRIISRANLNAAHYVEFVDKFYTSCMDKRTADDLSPYIEPLDAEAVTTNYAGISIHSSLGQISWGTVAPQLLKKGVPIIHDINETTASVSVDYQITAQNEAGRTEVYDVHEFYRMRYSEARTALLNFTRSASQIFDPQLGMISSKGLLLGVRSRNVNYEMNEDHSVVAFVQQGDLWSYVPGTGKFVRIYSFRKDSDSDFRDVRNQHDFKIIRMENNGDIDFVLYGYMNRGIREGYTGVGVFHYNAEQNVVEEKVFIPATESYDFLNESMGILSYVNESNQLFLLLGKNLYQIGIDDGVCRILAEGIQADTFVVSYTNRHAAWEETDKDGKVTIREIDFDTLKKRQIPSDEGQIFTTVGYMNEDLVYGVVLDGDILSDGEGHSVKGISTLRIVDFGGDLKKEYHKDHLYVTNIEMGNIVMEFDLCRKSGGTYVFDHQDNIMNNVTDRTGLVSVELTSTSRTGTLVRLAFEEEPEEDSFMMYAKLRVAQEHVVNLDMRKPEGDIYYVYAEGRLKSSYTSPAQAIIHADEELGVVLNRDQQYVWERGNKKLKVMLNTLDVPDAFLSGEKNIKKLQEALGDFASVVDLTGCSLDQVLYEVSAGRPVIVKIGKKKVAVIMGYDEYNTWLYDPQTGEITPYGLNDSTELFKKNGSIFISYIERANLE